MEAYQRQVERAQQAERAREEKELRAAEVRTRKSAG